MNWHLRLSEGPLPAVQLVNGDPPLVAVWLTPDSVYFYAEEDGVYYGGLDLSNPPDDLRSETWRDYLEGLRAANGAYLASVNLEHTFVLTSNDGRLHVYQRDYHQLILDVDGEQTVLEQNSDAGLISIGLDRELGTIGALSDDNHLKIYQQQFYLGAYPLESTAKKLFVPDESGTVVLIGEQKIQIADTAGQIQQSAEASGPIGAAACAPDGSRIVSAEQDVLKVYNARLQLLRQGSALDLLERSIALELLPENNVFLPSSPEAIAVSNTGKLAFALGGFLCCTSIDQLSRLPQPRKLF